MASHTSEASSAIVQPSNRKYTAWPDGTEFIASTDKALKGIASIVDPHSNCDETESG